MNLAELQAEVIAITARPDKASETLRAIKSATQSIHSRDYWRRDLEEVTLQFTDSSYIQAFDIYETLPFFRAVKYCRKVSGANLEIIEPEEYLNYFGNEKQDVAYLAGDNFQIRSSDVLSLVTLGYYKWPDLTDEGWNSWISNEFPNAIIFAAASQLLTSIGFSESAQIYDRKAKEEFFFMQRTAINAGGN